VVKVVDFKVQPPSLCCGFKSCKGLGFLHMRKLILGTMVVLLRSVLVSEKMHGGTSKVFIHPLKAE
jgi:hypothetical protein